MLLPAMVPAFILEAGEVVDVAAPAVELGETLLIIGTVLLAVVDEEELELKVVLVGADVGVKFTPVYTTCRKTSDCCPAYVVATEVACHDAPQLY
jgi:hypothetical protein